MHYGVKLPDVDALWDRAIRQPDGRFSDRTADDAAETAFWKENMEKRGGYAPDAYSRPIAQKVCQIMRENDIKDVLEIGPGWGNYTLDLARTVDHVKCVDISQAVIDYILRICRENGRNNVCGTVCKWEDFTPASRSDAVFGYNCFYRMHPLTECLRKINESAKKLCVIGMTSGPEQSFYREFELELGLNIRYDRLDYIYLVNALYQLGIDVNCMIIDLEKEYVRENIADLLRAETGRIQDEIYPEEKVLEILKRHYRLEGDGRYHFIHHFKAALIYWHPN